MKRLLLGAVLVGALATPAAAQNSADRPDPANMKFLEVGAVAPNFELPGATRHGILAEPIELSDFRGETVVLAFYFRARTRG